MTVFAESRTRINLMRAFAGESQARNRYQFAAEQARAQQLEVVAAAFEFTAGQEKAHAEVFYGMLAPLNGSDLLMDAGFPINAGNNVAQLLRQACHNEKEEAERIYPDFARIAREEGLDRAAQVFESIARVELSHAVRFEALADALEQGRLFAGQEETVWMCLHCGHLHRGKEAPQTCPVCQRGRGYMIREGFFPFAPGN